MKKIFFLCCIICFSAYVSGQTPVYKDSTASINDRVEDLLGRMTLDEKIGQMTQADYSALKNPDDITTYVLGSVLNGGSSEPPENNPTAWADIYDNFQQRALATRLAIPMIYGIDAVHGHNNVIGATIFPHNIGLGCTRDSDIVEQAAHITALEVAATGIDWTFAPCIAVPQDERWGRTYEGFGETPELTQTMSAAAVRGFQGDTLADKASILACAKHFLGDGGTTGGHDQGNTEVDEATLRAIHLPGYIAAINAGVGSIMASYSSWNGQKMHGNKYLLTDVLKTELGFKGFIVSDWAAIDQLPGDYASDIETSINAGIDMVMVPNEYKNFISTLKAVVQEGKISTDRIDDAVRRILKQKFRMGLFEHPYTDRSLLTDFGSAAHRGVARQAVRESLVMLKKKDGVLPLKKENSRILVAGDHADNMGYQCGGWTISWQGTGGDVTPGTTILDGIKQAAPSADVIFSEDGSYSGAKPDVAVVVIGELPYAEGRGDTDDLSLNKKDIELVKKLKDDNLKVVVVLISGRPLLVNPIIPNSDVLIAAWLPGTEGEGISDVLFGDYQPKGLLSHTWPKSMEQLPINVNNLHDRPLFPYDYGITSLDDAPSGSAPEFYSAQAVDSVTIEVAFNKAMADPSGKEAAFVVMKNGVQDNLFDHAELKAGDNTTLLLKLKTPLSADDVVTMQYDGGNIESSDGGVLQSFGPKDVYNAIDANSNFFSLPGKIEAEDYDNMLGVQTETTSDIGGGLNVGWIDDNDWLEYNIHVPAQGDYQTTFRVASLSTGGTFQLKKGSDVLATVDVPVTGDWQSWSTIGQNVNLPAGTYPLRLAVVKGGFNLNWMQFETVLGIDKDQENHPHDFALEANYPNPFNPTTVISYQLAVSSNVKLAVYDALGRIVKVLVDKRQAAGKYSVQWDARDQASGVYICKISAGPFSFGRKMLLLR